MQKYKEPVDQNNNEEAQKQNQDLEDTAAKPLNG